MEPLDGVLRRSGAAAQVFVADVAAPLLDLDDLRHLARVLRLRDGEVVVAADGRGRWCECRFRPPPRPGSPRSAGSDHPALEPLGPPEHDPLPGPSATVAFAPAKGDRPEWVVQKLTELGVGRIVPLLAERSVVRWEGARGARVVERLRRVAREAAAQSRRVWLAEVTEVVEVAALGGASGIALAQLGAPPPAAGLSAVAVGPEGGWSPAERRLGLVEVGLAPLVLRSETAALVAGARLMDPALGSPRHPAPPPPASRVAS